MTVQNFTSIFAATAFAAFAALSLPGGAHAQDTRAPGVQEPGATALMDRIDRLERDIRTLNQQLARMPAGGSAASTGVGAAPTDVGAAPRVEFTEGEGVMSRLMVRLSALENEVRTATGQSESLSFRIDQLTERLDKLLVDLDYRLARLEGGVPGGVSGDSLPPPAISAAPAPMGVSKVGAMPPVGQQAPAQGTVRKDGTFQPAPESRRVLGTVSQSKLEELVAKDGMDAPDGTSGDATVDTAAVQAPSAGTMTPGAAPEAAPDASTQAAVAGQSSVLPEGSAEERYRFAFDLTRQARYDEAEIAFKAFIAAHGDDALANNARYWLAETFYVRKNFMDAAQAFFEAYQNAPQGPKAPDALLKLGMSMAALDKATEACATFGKLRKEFTPLKANIEQALNREVKRLECK